MEKSAQLEEFYNEVVNAFVANVTEENKVCLGNAYKDYLHRYYDNYFLDAGEGGFNGVATMCIIREKAANFPKKEEEKRAMLFPDSEYLALEKVSLELGRIARNKKNGKVKEISKTQDEYMTLLNQHFEKVGQTFKYTAEKMMSEAILDLEYIFGDKESRSFRT